MIRNIFSSRLFNQLIHNSNKLLAIRNLSRTGSLAVTQESSATQDDQPQKKESDQPSEDQELAAKIDELRRQVDDYKDKYTRSLAENENVRRRNKKLLDDAKIYAIQSFAKDLLEVADVLEKAIVSVPSSEKNANSHLKTLHEGVVMTEVQLQTVFKKHGLLKENPIDEKFDPNFHEALFQQPFPGKTSGTVAVVEKIGYRLHDRPLRAALVGVVK